MRPQVRRGRGFAAEELHVSSPESSELPAGARRDGGWRVMAGGRDGPRRPSAPARELGLRCIFQTSPGVCVCLVR